MGNLASVLSEHCTIVCFGLVCRLFIALKPFSRLMSMSIHAGLGSRIRPKMTSRKASKNFWKKNKSKKAIFEAVKFPGDLERLEQCLTLEKVDCRNRHGSTPLIVASAGGLDDIVQYLLDLGADVNACDSMGWTALHYACAYAKSSTCMLLLRQPMIQIDAQNKGGGTPLLMASHSNIITVVEKLIDMEADVNHTNAFGLSSLMMAVDACNTRVSKLLVESGATLEESENVFGSTPFFIACQTGNFEIAAFLLERSSETKVDLLHIRNRLGLSPLMIAAANGQLDLVELMLRHGADPNTREQARDNIIVEKIKLHALSRKFSSAQAAIGSSLPLTTVSTMASLFMSKQRFERIGEGATALHYASREGDATILKVLLKYGADPAIATTTIQRLTPIDIAESRNHVACIHALAAFLTPS